MVSKSLKFYTSDVNCRLISKFEFRLLFQHYLILSIFLYLLLFIRGHLALTKKQTAARKRRISLAHDKKCHVS